MLRVLACTLSVVYVSPTPLRGIIKNEYCLPVASLVSFCVEPESFMSRNQSHVCHLFGWMSSHCRLNPGAASLRYTAVDD